MSPPGQEVELTVNAPDTGGRQHSDIGIYVAGDAVDWKPTFELYTRDLRSLFDAVASAVNLEMGFAASGYECPDGPAEDIESELVREYHVRVWRQLLSETRPWTPDKEEAEDVQPS
jgi:hypothetical protein